MILNCLQEIKLNTQGGTPQVVHFIISNIMIVIIDGVVLVQPQESLSYLVSRKYFLLPDQKQSG